MSPFDAGAYAPRATEIELRSGYYLDLADPDPADICIDDIATGLSHEARFAGQTSRFYPVAEHALLVCERLKTTGASAHVCLAGLHHDDSEAYIKDIPRPLKAMLRDYHQIEKRVTAAIWGALRLPNLSFEELKAVVAADEWALGAEAYALCRSEGACWATAGVFDPDESIDIMCMPDSTDMDMHPPTIRRLWLAEHSRLVHFVDALRRNRARP